MNRLRLRWHGCVALIGALLACAALAACGWDLSRARPGDDGSPLGPDGATPRPDAGMDGGGPLKRGIGQACQRDAQCEGGLCVDGFCCEATCEAPCAACNLPGKQGRCTLLAAGTPCAAPSCRSDVAGDALVQPVCNGVGAACVEQSETACDPYRCTSAGGKSACSTRCTSNADCTSLLCDLFVGAATVETCRPTSEICYVAAGGPGTGSFDAPCGTINDCLGRGRSYISVASGSYNESLVIDAASTVKIVAQADPPDVAGGKMPSVHLNPPDSTGVLVVAGAPTPGSGALWLRGFDVNGTAAGAGVRVESGAGNYHLALDGVFVRTSGAGRPAIDAAAGELSLRNARVRSAGGTALQIGKQTSATVEDVRVFSSKTGLEFSGTSLTVRSLVADGHSATGVHLMGGAVDVERLWAHDNVQDGLRTDVGVSGTLSNLLVHKNGDGVRVRGKVTLHHLTASDNVGYQLRCEGDASEVTVDSSIVWRSVATQMGVQGQDQCSFSYSDILGGGVGPGVIGKDPQFVALTGASAYRIPASSPCHDAGNPNGTPPSTDIDGAPRAVGVVDMGAFEVQSP